jgi:amino acid transporter
MIGDAFKAVFWSFFGVRKRSEYESDTQKLRPQHVIAAGIVAAIVFVLLLYGVVQLVTR